MAVWQRQKRYTTRLERAANAMNYREWYLVEKKLHSIEITYGSIMLNKGKYQIMLHVNGPKGNVVFQKEFESEDEAKGFFTRLVKKLLNAPHSMDNKNLVELTQVWRDTLIKKPKTKNNDVQR